MTKRVGRRGRSLWVVKLGGSLGGGIGLVGWLEALAGGGGRVVLVPGGGAFADAVRAMQRRWGFDDALAHRLALRAMEQYGLMLAGLQAGLRPAESRAAIGRALAAGEVPVWMPTRMALGRPDIPESWDVTSDSLAAWLATELAADALVLVKSVAVVSGTSVEDLAREGVVDPLLPRFLGKTPCRCIEAGCHGEMKAALSAGRLAGAVVTAAGDPE
jgi:dihydroneopterin aldolase